jgi:hypothetical protein
MRFPCAKEALGLTGNSMCAYGEHHVYPGH